MPSGILSGLTGALSGYSGFLQMEDKSKKEEEAKRLQHERLMSLENLRASNQSASQQAGFTQQTTMQDDRQDYEKEKLDESREYGDTQRGILAQEGLDNQKAAIEQAAEIKLKLAQEQVARFAEENKDNPERVKAYRESTLFGLAASKGMSEKDIADSRDKSNKTWETLEDEIKNKFLVDAKGDPKIALRNYQNFNLAKDNPTSPSIDKQLSGDDTVVDKVAKVKAGIADGTLTIEQAWSSYPKASLEAGIPKLPPTGYADALKKVGTKEYDPNEVKMISGRPHIYDPKSGEWIMQGNVGQGYGKKVVESVRNYGE